MCPSNGYTCAARTRGCAFAGPGPISSRAGGLNAGRTSLCASLMVALGSPERTAQLEAHRALLSASVSNAAAFWDDCLNMIALCVAKLTLAARAAGSGSVALQARHRSKAVQRLTGQCVNTCSHVSVVDRVHEAGARPVIEQARSVGNKHMHARICKSPNVTHSSACCIEQQLTPTSPSIKVLVVICQGCTGPKQLAQVRCCSRVLQHCNS